MMWHHIPSEQPCLSTRLHSVVTNQKISSFLLLFETCFAYEKVMKSFVCCLFTWKHLMTGHSVEQPSNLLSSFWSHPATRTASEVPPTLRRCSYQLAPPTTGMKNISWKEDIIKYQTLRCGFSLGGLLIQQEHTLFCLFIPQQIILNLAF